MKQLLVLAAFLSGLFLTSCAPKESAPGADRPRATVLMRDGTQVTGAVLSNSTTEIKIAGDDNITRTIPMAQVKSVDYGETPTPAAEPAREQPAAPNAATKPAQRETAKAPAPRPRRQPDQAHVAQHEHATESAITTKTFELPVGTEVSVRTEDTIDSAKAVEGQTFAAEVTDDVQDAAGATVIPRGANAQIIIRSASKGGRIRGASDLVLDLKSVSIEGREYELGTSDMLQRGKSGIGANRRTAEYTGGGAAVGAIIGAIAGGGKGAAIGAGAGAGAGAIAQVLTKGGAIKVPVETILTFKLDKPLHVVAAR